jgi:hypothetical protein
VWNWHPNAHDTLLSQLFRLSGTVFIPSGIRIYPHMSENIICIAPREPADLTNYLDLITLHNLVAPGGQFWELVRFLSQTAARFTWDWVKEEYKGTLDTLQEATGVLLTLEGPICPTRGQVLRSTPAANPCPRNNNQPRVNIPPRPTIRQAARGAPTHFGAAIADPDKVSDAASRNRHP